jgi:hypothetical protein
MGGSNAKSNIVTLTAREHFLIHWLLWKIHKNKSMTYAFHAMTKPVGNGCIRYTSASFVYAREAMANWMSENRSGENAPGWGKFGQKSSSFGSRKTEECKAVLSEFAKRRVERGIIPRAKRVINLDTQEVFRSCNEAQKQTTGNVQYAIRYGGTAGGHKYAYLDDLDQPIIVESKLKGYRAGSTSPFARPVLNLETGEIYPTITAAGKAVGMSGEGISYAIARGGKCKKGVFQYA